jgi:glutathione S-transferase
MKLYGLPPSPNTWKVRAVAAHLGLPLELHVLDFAKGENRAPDYLTLNPTGRTPTLADGDFVLWESGAIMQYLASQKQNTLWPDDVRTRVDIMRWMSWDLAHWGKESCEPLLFQRLVKKVFNLGPPDETIVARGLECFHRQARVLDAHLATHKYLVGDDVTLADFAVAAPLFHAEQCDLPLTDYPNIRAWFGRVSTLPAWRASAPAPMPAAA